MTQPKQCQNYVIEFVITISAQLYRNRLGQWAENQSVVVVVVIESLCSSREESEQMPVSYEVKPNYVHQMRDRDTLIEQSP